MITAKVELTQPLKQQRQFVAHTGSGHDFLLDDAAGSTGPKPIELVSAGLAGCTAFDGVDARTGGADPDGEERNPLRKAAIADTKAVNADVLQARSLLMPHLSFSEVATRGNDPVYMFGSKLRQ
jgi:hypothetical protein